MGCGIGARETMRPHVRHAALPARDVSAVAFDVPVVTIMAVVPPRVMAGVIDASMAPCTVMRSCRSRSRRYGDCRRTQRQRDETKRPAERNQLNHTQSSVAPPFPTAFARDERRAAFCDFGYGDRTTGCGSAETISGSFREHSMTKKNRCCLIAAASINCDFRARPFQAAWLPVRVEQDASRIKA